MSNASTSKAKVREPDIRSLSIETLELRRSVASLESKIAELYAELIRIKVEKLEAIASKPVADKVRMGKLENSNEMILDRVQRLEALIERLAARLPKPKREEPRVIHLYEEPTTTGKNAGKGITPKIGGGENSPGWENAVRAFEESR